MNSEILPFLLLLIYSYVKLHQYHINITIEEFYWKKKKEKNMLLCIDYIWFWKTYFWIRFMYTFLNKKAVEVDIAVVEKTNISMMHSLLF